MKQQTDYTIPLIGAILLIAMLISSCSVKRYSYEAVNLQEGEISKYHVKANLISADRTMKGFKHVFVTEKGDTLAPRFYAKPMEVNKCYWVWKTKLEKNL